MEPSSLYTILLHFCKVREHHRMDLRYLRQLRSWQSSKGKFLKSVEYHESETLGSCTCMQKFIELTHIYTSSI